MTRDTGYLFLILSLFFFATGYGQAEKKPVPLKDLLSAIEKQHRVKFNYLDEDVAPQTLIAPEGRIPLNAKLTYITNRTKLSFKQSGIYIVLYAARVKEGYERQCAYITDENGNPVADAIIQYNTTKLNTGKDGYFEFPPDVTTLFIEHIAYQPMQWNKTNTYGDCAEIRLTLNVNQLQEVVTERFLATGIAKAKDGSYNIKPAKFGILPGLTEADVLQAMQQLPGINSVDETVSNINVRGGTHDQNLFTWNGIRLFQTGHFFGLISALNPNLAHDIKISKNGTSAFYGESVSSAVDISSHPTDIGSTRGSIGANMIGVDAYTRIKTSENANLELSARRSFTDVLAFPTYTEYSKRIFQNTVVSDIDTGDRLYNQSDKEFYFYDFTAQYHRKIGIKHHLYIDAIGIYNKLNFIQSTYMPYGVAIRSSDLKQQTLGSTVSWHTRWNSKHATEAGIYISEYYVNGLNSSFENSQPLLQRNKITHGGLNLNHTYRLNEKLSLKGGYQYNSIDITNTDQQTLQTTISASEALNTHALITEGEYKPLESPLYIKAGLRVNYIEQFKRAYIEPRAHVGYKIAPGWQLDVQAERKSQTATQVVAFQEDFLGIENRRWVLANNGSIPVQRSSQASVGVTLKRNGWLVTLDNFYKKVNGITSLSQAFNNQFESVSATGSYEVYGSEFLVQKQFRHFYVWLSYAYNHNNYHFNSFTPSTFNSNFELPYTINNAVTYEYDHLKIALGSKFFSGRPYTRPLTTIPIEENGQPQIAYDYPNGRRISSYLQVNFSAGYSVALSKRINLQAGVSVLNVLNRRNIINRFYRVNDTGEGIEVVNTYGLYRTPNAMVKVSF